MFLSKSDFDDNDEVEGTNSVSAASSTNHVLKSQPSISSTNSSSVSSSSNLYEEALTAPTPAMRKKKMEELRQQALAKKKKAPLASAGVVRAHDGPKTITSPTAASSSSSPSSAPATSPGASHSPPLKSLPVEGAPEDARSGAVVDESAVVAEEIIKDRDPGIQALLAAKQAEKDKQEKERTTAEKVMADAGIQPVFDPVKKQTATPAAMAAGVKLDFSDMRNFLTSPLPRGINFQCFIVRNKKGLSNKVYPAYELYMEEGERFLMCSKKRSKNKTSNYIISMDKTNLEKESGSYLGKVRSNFVGTEFICYDKGINPKEMEEELKGAGEKEKNLSIMSVRQELCAVFYESNILGSRGPRKMTALVPTVKKDGSRTIFRPLKEEEGLAVKYKETPNSSDFLLITNKTPKWNDQVGAYVLNFNGRVTMASVKNFQLIHQDDPESILLQFGRVGKDTFTMDCQWPLSPLQAFAICLSSFDYKLACE